MAPAGDRGDEEGAGGGQADQEEQAGVRRAGKVILEHLTEPAPWVGWIPSRRIWRR